MRCVPFLLIISLLNLRYTLLVSRLHIRDFGQRVRSWWWNVTAQVKSSPFGLLSKLVICGSMKYWYDNHLSYCVDVAPKHFNRHSLMGKQGTISMRHVFGMLPICMFPKLWWIECYHKINCEPMGTVITNLKVVGHWKKVPGIVFHRHGLLRRRPNKLLRQHCAIIK